MEEGVTPDRSQEAEPQRWIEHRLVEGFTVVLGCLTIEEHYSHTVL